MTRLGLAIVLTLLTLPLRARPARAVEVPTAGAQVYAQTNGPNAPIGRGDWYTSTANGVGAGYHYLAITIPCDWPTGTPANFDLFSPGMHTPATLADEDDNGTPANTTFELYAPGTTVGPAPNIPAPATGLAGSLTNYLPSASTEQWFRFYTTPTASPGRTPRSPSA